MKIIEQNTEKVKTTDQKKLTEYNQKKRMNIKLVKVYEKLGEKEKAKRLKLCANLLVFAKNKIISALHCQLRLCPVCSWRRAEKTYFNVFKIINEPEFDDLEFLFMTLTVKNCPAIKLNDTLDLMFNGWRKLTLNDRQVFRKSFEGTFRALEVTYNPDKKTYHPHFHVLVAVKKNYFKKSNEDYISHEKLINLWKNACNLDYEPDVDIRKVTNSKHKQIAEVAKYTVKPTDYIARKNVVRTLDEALYRRRLIAYGGIFAKVKKKLKIQDDPIFDDENEKQTNEQIYVNPEIKKEVMKWNFGTKTYELIKEFY